MFSAPGPWSETMFTFFFHLTLLELFLKWMKKEKVKKGEKEKMVRQQNISRVAPNF